MSRELGTAMGCPSGAPIAHLLGASVPRTDVAHLVGMINGPGHDPSIGQVGTVGTMAFPSASILAETLRNGDPAKEPLSIGD